MCLLMEARAQCHTVCTRYPSDRVKKNEKNEKNEKKWKKDNKDYNTIIYSHSITLYSYSIFYQFHHDMFCRCVRYIIAAASVGSYLFRQTKRIARSAYRAPQVYIYIKTKTTYNIILLLLLLLKASVHSENAPNTGGPPDESFSVRPPRSISLWEIQIK